MASKGRGRRRVFNADKIADRNSAIVMKTVTEILKGYSRDNSAIRESVMASGVREDQPTEINITEDLKIRVDIVGMHLIFRSEEILLIEDPRKAAHISEIFSGWAMATLGVMIMDEVGCKCGQQHGMIRHSGEEHSHP